MAARNEECGDRMIDQLLVAAPDIKVSASIVKAAAENPKCGKQMITRLPSRKACDRITEQAMMAVVGNEEWGTAWVEVLLDSQPSIATIGMVVRAAAASGPRRGISVIWTLLATCLTPVTGGSAGARALRRSFGFTSGQQSRF